MTSKTFKWTVEFEVAECWVADGFNLTDERALDMLSNDLGWTDIQTELKARVVKAPEPERIAKAQGYTDVSKFLADMQAGR
ncbi:MAG TPA: hypothetical protein VNY06_05685 [Methylocella sp.]|jgi:hypothetical protein|nr:hypothetical protein [Methylocella sp.]